MKFYKINRKFLKWNEDIKAVAYNWDKLPILVDKDYNVILGSSIRNTKRDEWIVIIVDFPNAVYKSFFEIEKLLAEESSCSRYDSLKNEIARYLQSITHPQTQMRLFEDFREDGIITEDNYVRPNLSLAKEKEAEIEEEYFGGISE